MNESEREARVELAACYRIFAQLGWTEQFFWAEEAPEQRRADALPLRNRTPAF